MITRIAAFILMAASLAFAADPFVGTWKPDLEKTRFIKPQPNESNRRRVVKWEATGKDTFRLSWTVDGKVATRASGNETEPVEMFLDGKEHGSVADGFRTATRIDERHVRIIVRSASGSIQNDDVVSGDGNTLTITRKGITEAGRPVDEILVYTKQ
jgi:hypothetical protein